MNKDTPPPVPNPWGVSREDVAKLRNFIDEGCAAFDQDKHDALQTVDSLLSALFTAPNGGWRPISEAPKDGTRVLLCFESGYVTMAHWDGDGAGGQNWNNALGETLTARATHFMLLPTAPNPPLSGG